MSKLISKFTSTKHNRRESKSFPSQTLGAPLPAGSSPSSPSPEASPSNPSLPLQRDRTTSSIRPLASYGDYEDFAPASSSARPPRLDIDFRIPGETLAGDLGGLENSSAAKGELGNAFITTREIDTLCNQTYTSEQARIFWKHTGDDLRALAVDQHGIFEYRLADFSESDEDEFYRLVAIFTVASCPNLLASFPSLSNYFPPPAFVAADHDWIADYTSHSGWIREQKILARALRWVTKRVVQGEGGPGIASDDGALPAWYLHFAGEEQRLHYPPDAFVSILSTRIANSHRAYLDAVFEQVALIGANVAKNGASVEWLCGVLGWWLLEKHTRGTAREDALLWQHTVDLWKKRSLATKHLFFSWVRAQASRPVIEKLPGLISNMADEHLGGKALSERWESRVVLTMEMVNEVEHGSTHSRLIAWEQAMVALLREARYGRICDVSAWQSDEAGRSSHSHGPNSNVLLELLLDSYTSAGIPLSKLDPSRLGSDIDTPSYPTPIEYRPFSTVSRKSSLATPIAGSRLADGAVPFPHSAPASLMPQADRASPSPTSHQRYLVGLGTRMTEAPDGSGLTWSTFASVGFDGRGDASGMQLEDAFVQRYPAIIQAQRGWGGKHNIRAGVGAEQQHGRAAKQWRMRATLDRLHDLPGSFRIIDLKVDRIPYPMLSFLRDLLADDKRELKDVQTPCVVFLRAEASATERLKLQSQHLLILGSRTWSTTPDRLPASPGETQQGETPKATIQPERFVPLRPESPVSTAPRPRGNRRSSLFGIFSNPSTSRKTSGAPSIKTLSSPTSRQSSYTGVQRAHDIADGQLKAAEGQVEAVTQQQSSLGSGQVRSTAGSQTAPKEQVPSILDGVQVESAALLDDAVVDAVPAASKTAEMRETASRAALPDTAPSVQDRAAGEQRSIAPESWHTRPSDGMPVGSLATSEVSPDLESRARRSDTPSPNLELDTQGSLEVARAIPLPSADDNVERLHEVVHPSIAVSGDIDSRASEPKPQLHHGAAPIELGPPISPRKPSVPADYIAPGSLEEGEVPVSVDRPTFARSLMAGAIAGLSVDLLFYPIDTIKTRLQSKQGFINAGGFKGIYRGIGSVGVGSAPGAAVFFTAYESLKKTLPEHSSTLQEYPALAHMTAASGGEIMACLIRVPTEIVKSRVQTSAYGIGSTSLSTAMRLWQTENLKGFYRGFGITLAREIPFTAIQFPLYEALKVQMSKRLLADGRKPAAHEAALCGMLAGGVAAACTTPLDVVKTRAMLEVKNAKAVGSHRSGASILSIPSRLMQISSQEGVAALFAGVVPRTSWISLGGAVFLGVYDLASNPGQVVNGL